MNTSELKVMVQDLETFRKLCIIGGYIPDEDRWVMFEISRRKNELDAAVKFLKEEPIQYYITFNGVLFDSQVCQYILENYEEWYDKSTDEILKLIYEFVQEKLISAQDYGIAPPYKEQYMDIKNIDLFLIFHMNNEARRTSLKWCMYAMDEDIELMEVDHASENLTDEEIEQTIHYWKNDIKATWQLWKYAIGETDHGDYKGKNKIQLRIDLIKEMGLPWTAINWNDVKIGDELNKKSYMDLSGINHNKLWDKVKNRKSRAGFKFKECYPRYMKFQTKEFQELFKQIGNTQVNLNEKQEFHINYNGTDYTVAKGGGHSGETARITVPEPNQIIMDADVGSMYPNIIRKRQLYPAHLGIKWNEAYVSNIAKRLEAKKLYKQTGDKKWDNLQETYKLVLNGSFGKLIDRTNWQYDPYIGMCVTIGGQVDIYMLAEQLELTGIHVISLNTDGVTAILDRDKLQEYYRVCKEWEVQVGNDTLGQLEYVEYEKLVQLSVNDYIAVKKGDWKEIAGTFQLDTDNLPKRDKRVKKKGDFLTSYELYKNKSKSIIPIALEAYYVHGISVEDTINNHRNIYSFGIAKKASKDYSYIGTDGHGNTHKYKKLIRYYCALKTAPSAEKLWKVKNDNSEKKGPTRSHCESTSPYQVVFNQKIDTSNWEALGIDTNWYIQKCKEIIGKIEPEMKRQFKKEQTGQISLF